MSNASTWEIVGDDRGYPVTNIVTDFERPYDRSATSNDPSESISWEEEETTIQVNRSVLGHGLHDHGVDEHDYTALCLVLEEAYDDFAVLTRLEFNGLYKEIGGNQEGPHEVESLRFQPNPRVASQTRA